MRAAKERAERLHSISAHEAARESGREVEGPPGRGREGQPDSRLAVLEQAYQPVLESLDRVKKQIMGLARDQSPILTELLEHVLDTKGKRIRPAITLLASRFHPNDGVKAEKMAMAVELLHVASLIHDDTVDNSDTRRGKATVSSVWGRNAAVMLGDYVFATSATFVCDTGNIRVIRRFSETIMDLSSGELTEMTRAFSPVQTREEYLQALYKKTASLFFTSAESGAVLSGAPEGDVDALKGYGYNLGMAFQIVDDILDFDGTSEEVGKPVGRDLAQGIMTLPAIIALEDHPRDNPIHVLFRRPTDQEALQRAVETVQEPSNMERAYEVADQYCGVALEQLARLEKSQPRDSLEELVGYVLRRRS